MAVRSSSSAAALTESLPLFGFDVPDDPDRAMHRCLRKETAWPSGGGFVRDGLPSQLVRKSGRMATGRRLGSDPIGSDR
jgi:hypothetical protein